MVNGHVWSLVRKVFVLGVVVLRVAVLRAAVLRVVFLGVVFLGVIDPGPLPCFDLPIVRAQEMPREEAERLERYLRQLGLTDLRAIQLERMIERSESSGRRLEWAQQLGDLYAEQLTRNLDQLDRYADLQRRIKRLLDQVPEAKTPALEVMLLQAEYQRAETLVNQGQAAADSSDSFGQAEEILRRITPILETRDRELWQRMERLQQQLDDEPDAQRLEEGEAELQRLQVIAGRAAYFAGWSSYYQGLLIPAERTQRFRAGREIFRRLLGMAKDVEYRELDAEWLGLNSTWRARALIGLGLCEAGLNDVPASRNCFALLDSPEVPATIRDQSSYWYFQGLIGGGHRQEALQYARQQIGELSGGASQGKVSFCAAVLRAGVRTEGEPTARDREFVNLGTQGLSKLGQANLLREMILRHGITADEARDFFSLWLRGQQYREQADQEADSKAQQEKYREAVEVLAAALQAPEARGNVAAAERCRVELAWCHFQLGQFAEAARYYQQAAAGLRGKSDSAAVDAGWMAFLAHQKRVSQGEDQVVTSLAESLAWLKNEFPRHELTKRAEFLLMREQANLRSPEDQLSALRDIPADHPNYPSAQLEICRQLQQAWREAEGDSQRKAGEEFVQALDRLLDREASRFDETARVTLLLMRVEFALAQQPPDTRAAARHLQAVEPLLSGRDGAKREVRAEFHYRSLELARVAEDEEGLRRHGDWFVEQGTGTRFELPGLVAVARHVDRSWERASAEQRRRVAERGLLVYQRLTERLGDDPETLTGNRNAQVAGSKVAFYAEQLEQFDVAQQALARLLDAFPNDKGYLRRAGLIAVRSQQFERSLTHWRTLLAGLSPGTDSWYEAKYYQLVSLREVDPSAAERVFRQFRLLDPELGSPSWREQFSELERKFGLAMP